MEKEEDVRQAVRIVLDATLSTHMMTTEYKITSFPSAEPVFDAGSMVK